MSSAILLRWPRVPDPLLLHLGPEGLGILLAVAAAGALVGSAWLSLGRRLVGWHAHGDGCIAVTLAVFPARRQIWSL